MEQPRMKWTRVIVGSILFGVIFGLRNEIPNQWLRILVAALAGAVLSSALLYGSLPQPSTKRTIVLIVGCILSAVILSLGSEIANQWLRILVAALAGAILGETILLLRRPPGT